MLPAWVPEIETKPAPGDLLLLQAFVNTFEGDTGVDLLTDNSTGRRWLHDSGILTAAMEVDDASLGRLREVREAFRALLVHNAGLADSSPIDIDRLNKSLGGATIGLHADTDDGCTVRTVPDGGDPVGIVVVRLLLIIRDAQRDGTWERLKACSRSGCRWAYYDRSHSRRGRWCDMATCGNRVKNQALRVRRQG